MHQDRAVLRPGNIFQHVTPAFGSRGGRAETKKNERKFGSHEGFNSKIAKKLRPFVAFDKAEPCFWIEFSAVEFAAAFEAGDGAFDSPDAREILAAPGTTVEEP